MFLGNQLVGGDFYCFFCRIGLFASQCCVLVSWYFDAYYPRFSCPRCKFIWTSLCLTSSQIYKYRSSILLDICLFMVPFAIPVAVASSQFIGLGGCGCPSSLKVSLMILDYFAFSNSSPSSSSAYNTVTNLSIWHMVNIAPFRCMGCLYCGFCLRKKCPTARIWVSLSHK